MTNPRAVAVVGDESTMFDRLEALKSVLAPELTGAELELFAIVCTSRGLDPFTRQVYASKRQGRVTFQVGIDGFRSLAERTGEYDGQDEPEYGPDCACGEMPKGHPESARVRVYSRGKSRPITFTALWHEYKPAPGNEGRGDAMWRKMPRLMLGKCAESGALRKAFPQVYGGIYSDVEMERADSEADAAATEPVGLKARLLRKAAPVGTENLETAEAVVEPELEAPPPPDDDDFVEGEIVDEAPAGPAPMSKIAFNRLALAAHVTKADVTAGRERLGIGEGELDDDSYARLAVHLGLSL
jgi:phage recombination protein Bet